ncbi:MAG: biofilm PGA synthesis protein PgaC [Planctomycetaceae bacterium]|nr:MAG: biofilm PGA synthesis protein PgaC [Planctomycetaceae bacterium]
MRVKDGGSFRWSAANGCCLSGVADSIVLRHRAAKPTDGAGVGRTLWRGVLIGLLVLGGFGSTWADEGNTAAPQSVRSTAVIGSATTADATTAGVTAGTAAEAELIRVGIYDHSTGTAKGPKSLRRFLVEDSGFRCVKLTPADIRAGKLADVDVLIMPGGSGSGQSRNLEAEGREAIREFVRGGGGYVGICAGSYLATSHYEWSLHLINAQVVDREHWARGTGTCRLKLTAVGRSELGEPAEEVDVYYGQGPLLAPHDRVDLPAYETLAEYASEIAKKGAPTGVMIGTTAIARAEFGAGRVICYSPHPEVATGPNHLMAGGVRWAAGIDQPAVTLASEETDE